MKPKVIAVVVTYNRKDLLLKCLCSLLQQTVRLEQILVLDNASTDGTENALASNDFLEKKSIEHIKLSSNTGGSGGFYEGLKKASLNEDCWIWLMDDDAIAAPEALEKLLQEATDKTNVYGSVALEESDSAKFLCWPVAIQDIQKTTYRAVYHTDLPDVSSVVSLPFLGLFIHTSLVQNIGLPERDYFVCGEDVEYCLRARHYGARIYLVKSSILRHPLPQRTTTRFLGRKFFVVNLAPWKQYYDIRNRILIAKKHLGKLLWLHTIPGILVRWFTIILRQNDRWEQSKAFFRGITDGLLGNKGCRWPPSK